MSSHSVRNSCPLTCRKVKEQIRNAIEEAPWLLDGIFPRKENDVHRRLPPDVISKDIRDEPKRVIEVQVHKVPVEHPEKIETDIDIDILPKAIVESKIIQEFPIIQKQIIPTEKITDRDDEKIDLIEEKELVQKPAIIEERIVIPTEEITDRDEEKIDLVEEKELAQEPAIIEERIVIPTEEITDRDEEKIDLVEEKELVQEVAIIQDQIITPTEKIIDRHDEKIDLIEEKRLEEEATIIQDQIVTPTEKIADYDEEKIDLIEEKKLDEELAIVDEHIAIPTEKIADHDVEKIDSIEEKKLVEEIVEEPAKKVPIAIEEPQIVEDEIDQAAAAEIKLEPSQELEEYLPVEAEKSVEYGEDEESITDYERFIDEELQEFLPAVIAKEIPEVPKAMRREISRNAATLYEEIDRERPVRPPSEREVITAIPEERPARVEITARRRVLADSVTTEDACDETCPLVKEQKGEQVSLDSEGNNALCAN